MLAKECTGPLPNMHIFSCSHKKAKIHTSIRKCHSPFSPADQSNVFADSVDPNEPSHQDLHCLPFCFDFWLSLLVGTMVLSRFKDRRVHFRNSVMKGKRLLLAVHHASSLLLLTSSKLQVQAEVTVSLWSVSPSDLHIVFRKKQTLSPL